MTELLPPAGPHTCALPVRYSFDTGRPVGTLRRCPCGVWWLVVPGPDLSGPAVVVVGPFTRWVRLRWWHRSARRRLSREVF